jgi:hypothetical protein
MGLERGMFDQGIEVGSFRGENRCAGEKPAKLLQELFAPGTGEPVPRRNSTQAEESIRIKLSGPCATLRGRRPNPTP